MCLMNDWIYDLDNAIADLEARKRLLMKSCVTCWDPSIDWALDGLKIIRELLRIHEKNCVVNNLERLIIEIHEEKRNDYD